MATVYRATDLRLDRVVALKIMHASLAEDPGFVSRFEREARSAARLSDPHLVSVFDQGTDGPIVYLVMEFVSGRTVRAILREHGPLLPVRALALLEPVLEALAVAHRAGIVHRDVKPENVMISNEGAVKVTDFGLARAIANSSSTTTHGVLIGTVAYLSPEQVEGRYADTRADVYGAGILLYELLTGDVPFAGETPLSVAYQHVHGTVPAPSTLRPGIPPEVDELVIRATARDPADRYIDADDFLEHLRDVADRMPGYRALPTAMPTRPLEMETQRLDAPTREPRPAKPRRPRRRRGPLVLLTLVLLAIVIGVGTYLIGSHHSVAVPSVTSLSVADAQTRMSQAGLKLDASQSAFSDTVAAGDIIQTDPPAGQAEPVGGTVRAIVSKGPQRFAVPALTGLSQSDATAALTSASLTVGNISQVYDDHIPAGDVVRSAPASGVPLQRSTAVDLFISKGPQPVQMPQVVGLSRIAAGTALTGAGLTATITLAYSDTIPRDQVISATVPAGTTVNHGSNVGLTVSKGPPPVRVPNVVGLSDSAAESALTAVGLKYTISEPLGSIVLHSVRSQSIPANTMVPKFTNVIIYVV